MPGSIEEAQSRAAALDRRLSETISGLVLPPSQEVSRSLRSYLQELADREHRGNNVFKLIRLARDGGGAQVELGPSIDKGPGDQYFGLASGARLSFGVSLKTEGKGSRLLAYRFHLQLPARSALQFLRFDLNKVQHPDPLSEPRCHLHLGIRDARLPCPVLSPIEVLDRIFFVLEPSIR